MHLLQGLSLTSNTIPSYLLIASWLGLMRVMRRSSYGIAFFSLGATFIHELCHLVYGFLLCAKPASFSLWPRRDGKHWVLGSVGFTNLNIWNSAFVAFAPLTMLWLGWVAFEYWMLPSFLGGYYLNWLVAGYAVTSCLIGCIPSPADVKIGALSALMYGGIGYGLWQALH